MQLGPSYVVSDLHVRGPAGGNTRAFLRFIDQRVRPSGWTLLIVGDLFDWWYARPGYIPPEFAGVLAALESLPRVVWLEGNHDMRIARALPGTSRLTVRERPLRGEHGGRSFEFRHGDLLDEDDTGYRALRGLLRSPLMDAATAVLGGPRSQQIGERVTSLRNAQKGGLGSDHTSDAWLAAAKGYAARTDADLTVVGHGHWLGWFPEGLVCLGDWVHWCSYLELPPDGSPRLRRFVDGGHDPVLAEGPTGPVPRLDG